MWLLLGSVLTFVTHASDPPLPPIFNATISSTLYNATTQVVALSHDALQFPNFCNILPTTITAAAAGKVDDPSIHPNPITPVPCRPALFGASSYANDNIQVVWYHGDGCSDAPPPPPTTYQNKFVLIPRGSCPFVIKTLNAQHQNASGVLIVDYHSQTTAAKQKERQQFSAREVAADSVLIKMWAERKDQQLSTQIHIPVLSIRNEHSNRIQNRNMSFRFTTKCRAELAYISGMDRLARYTDDWNATAEHVVQSQTLYTTLGVASTILGSYSQGEYYLRKSIQVHPHKSPKAVPIIHKLGILLANHTNDNETKWKEAFSFLPGSKAYLNNLAEVLIQRVEKSHYPAWLVTDENTTSLKDSLLLDGLVILSKAAAIQGTVYTPRVVMNQAKIMTMLNMDHDFVREKLVECLEDAAAYGDELVSISCTALIQQHDVTFWWYTPAMLEKKRVYREWWKWLVETTLWPVRSLVDSIFGDDPSLKEVHKPTQKKRMTGKDLEDLQGHRL